MRPLVGFAEADERHARFLLLHIIKCGVYGERIKNHIGTEPRRVPSETAQQFGNFNFLREGIFPSWPDRQFRPLAIQNEWKHIPGADCRDAAVKAFLLVDPFENGDVRIRFLRVAVNARIAVASENFIVTWIRKIFAIYHFDNATFALISQKLSVA